MRRLRTCVLKRDGCACTAVTELVAGRLRIMTRAASAVRDKTRWYHCRGDETATDSALDLREWTFSAREGLDAQFDASVGTMTWLRSWRRDPDAPRFSSCRSRRVQGSRGARFGLLRRAASLACRAAHSVRLRLDRWMPGALFCSVVRFGVATFASSEAASGRRCCLRPWMRCPV